MENVITFMRYWYLIKRTTNSAGIRANWINCVLYKVLLNLHFFPVLNIYCTEPYLGPVQRSYVYLYRQSRGPLIPIKSSFNFSSVKSLKEYSSIKQYQYAEGFQRFHTGLRLRCAACLSLQFFSFWLYTLWHATLVCRGEYSKRKSSITAPGPLTTKLSTKSVLVYIKKRIFTTV